MNKYQMCMFTDEKQEDDIWWAYRPPESKDFMCRPYAMDDKELSEYFKREVQSCNENIAWLKTIGYNPRLTDEEQSFRTKFLMAQKFPNGYGELLKGGEANGN